jgi:hypothetical protein
MDKSQIGRAGELAIELYTLITAGGEVDIYSSLVDDDHVDLVAGIRGGRPTLGIRRRRLLDLSDRSDADRAHAHDLHRGITGSPQWLTALTGR